MKKILYSVFFFSLLAVLFVQCAKDDLSIPSDTGTGGSLAAMTIINDHLYIIDNENIKIFRLTNPAQPAQIGEVNVGFGIETIFPYGGMLFIGSQTGMYIYDLQNPASPTLLAEHTHFYGCDPVVANDSIAFVTVRSAEWCRGTIPINQLELVDVTDPAQPYSIDFVDMNNPAGLGLDGDYLFVTDGAAGIKVFDVSDPYNEGAVLINSIPVNVFDVILLDGLMIAVGEENLYQFDYTDINNIMDVSTLSYQF